MLRKRTRVFFYIFVVIVFGTAKVYYDTNTIEVKKYQVRHSALGTVLSGLKIVHLSDLHIKQWSNREKKIIEILNQEKPDLIFLTGDYIKNGGPYKEARLFFDQLKAPLGTYAVLGNTEYYNANGSCALCHQEGSKELKENPNPVFLKNSQISLRVRGKDLTIFGVDDPVSKKSNLKLALKNTQILVPSILLAHSPEIFSEVSDLGLDLVLSGHTHGGQVGIVGYLRKIFPLESALEFLDGFFQRGKTLMYVSRGLGTSFFPFRLGIKPEIVFFEFRNPSGQIGISELQITNAPSKIIFAGLGWADFLETFNVIDFFKKKLFKFSNKGNTPVLFDFESPVDLEKLNWECHKWFERVKEHATSGMYSLKVSLPPGQYPGIDLRDIPSDWSAYACLNMDVYNPSKDEVAFHIRIDDHNSKWEYANRFDRDVLLKPGPNRISIPTNSIKTNLDHRRLNLQKVRRLIVFAPNNQKQRDLFIDNIRLN